MKCKRCNRLVDDTKSGMHKCKSCGLPFFVGKKGNSKKIEVVTVKDEEEDGSEDELDEVEEE